MSNSSLSLKVAAVPSITYWLWYRQFLVLVHMKVVCSPFPSESVEQALSVHQLLSQKYPNFADDLRSNHLNQYSGLLTVLPC